MSRYLESTLFRVGLVLLVVGSGPLLAIMLVAKLGFTADPNPNPVFCGILAGLTFWPALILLALAVWRVRRGGDAGRA